MSAPAYKRTPSPAVALLAMRTFMRCVFTPMFWVAQKRGRIDKMIEGFHKRRQKEIEKKNPFRNYVPGPQDVFVMTYPKSGTNWMMQIVYQLIHHGEGEFDHIHNVAPWPDAELMSPMMRGYAIPLEQATGWQTAPERKRVIKTHFNWELLTYSEEAKYIAVIRDPKDAFVSAYYFMGESGMGSLMFSVDTLHRMFLTDRFFLGGSWPANAAGYWAQRHRPNVLVLSFKSMKRDLEGTVRRVAEFLGIKVGDNVIQEVCRRASFEYMKKIDHKFSPDGFMPSKRAITMVRKGRQGGSGELLTAEQQSAIDEYCVAEMKRLAPDFPYEEFCDVTLTKAVSQSA